MKDKKNSNIALILSATLHIVVLLFLLLQEQKKKELAENIVEIDWVELESLSSELESVQIVQQDDKSVNEKVPEKDYKLSKNNQDVNKETKSEKNGAFQNRKNKMAGIPKTAPPKASIENKKQDFLNKLKPALFDNQYSASKLAPTPAPALTGAEVSQNDDYLKDVAAGAETLLKTREFVYYSYYNRIKRKLRQHWEPRIKKKIIKILRKGRKIASVNDKITRLVITLDQGGELVRIQVKSASGYNDLDDAAIEALRAAAPFPNPPNGIVTGAGEVNIPWDFVLET